MTEKLYMFKGGMCLQYDISSRTVDPEFPKSTMDFLFPDVTDPAFSNIVNNISNVMCPPGLIHLISGKVSARSMLFGYERDIEQDFFLRYFNLIPPEFVDGVDAIWQASNSLVYLFKEDYHTYCTYDGNMGNCQNRKLPNAGYMPLLPAAFNSDFDAVIEVGGNRPMFLKGSEIFVYHKKDKPMPISTCWPGTEKFGFDHDIQAAVVLPKAVTVSKAPS
jgi:hypothetical protein